VTGIAMPDGNRYRISSIKRYIVVVNQPPTNRWLAVYRSDVESRAVNRWRAEARAHTADGVHLIDARYNGDGSPAVIR
jgi:hypothetical protein